MTDEEKAAAKKAKADAKAKAQAEKNAANPVFAKAFRGCVSGGIYPTDFEPGEDCPEELIDAADAVDAVETDEKKCAELRKHRQGRLDAQAKAAEAEAEE